MAVPAGVDFGSAVASCHHSLSETCHRDFGRGSRQTHQTVTIAAHRLSIFVVEGNQRYDLACVDGHLLANMKGISASNDGSKDWASAENASSRPAAEDGVSETENDNGSSRDSGSGRLTDVYPFPCVSFSPSCPSSP